jgi:hypothetical protein
LEAPNWAVEIKNPEIALKTFQCRNVVMLFESGEIVALIKINTQSAKTEFIRGV